MKTQSAIIQVVLMCIVFGCPAAAQAQDPSSGSGQGKPNIVLVFMDNFGWGEPGFNGGGIIRGAPTPRCDAPPSADLSTRNGLNTYVLPVRRNRRTPHTQSP